jgi:uncharacterized protein (TIGR03084 family)
LIDYAGLLADLQAEHDDLVAAMAGISEADWDRPTPAPGWSTRDQISHLAFFDGVTVRALTQPDAFATLRDEIMKDLSGYVESVGASNAARSGAEMLDWWGTERSALVKALRDVDPSAKVPWFGPSMAAASKATARIMETWAHGQDIVDGLKLARPVTDRIEHVCHIGARAFPNSFRANGREVPETPVYVELVGPNGQTWSFGATSSDEVVRGDALDFALVVTQRRHPSDTRLHIVGPVATEWMSIAQAFAGPPGEGRQPGQFK